MTTQVAADLRAAAEVLRRDGWVQESWGQPDDCKCALGAVTAVVSSGVFANYDRLKKTEQYRRARDAGAALLDAVGWGGTEFVDRGVTRWNDTPGRTAEEVIAALEAAADAAEAQS